MIVDSDASENGVVDISLLHGIMKVVEVELELVDGITVISGTMVRWCLTLVEQW